jgi:hypothetical protein
MSRPALTAALLAALLLAAVAAPAWAAPSREDLVIAAEAMKEGLAQEKKGAWVKARNAFERVVERNDNPGARIHLARAQAKLGHLLEAMDHYGNVVDNKRAPFNLKAVAKKERQALEERVPRLNVKVPPDFKGKVRIDDIELTHEALGVPMPVNPGTRMVIAEADGFQTFKKQVVLSDKLEVSLDVVMVPAPKDETKAVEVDKGGSSHSTLGYVSLGVGAAGLVVGTAFGLSARSTRNELRASCADNVCNEALRDTYNRGRTQATISTVGFVVGGVGVAAGIYFLATAPSGKEAAPRAARRLEPVVGLGYLGAQGSF